MKPDHKNCNGSKYNVMVEWENGKITHEPLTTIAADDPVTCAIYAKEHDLLNIDRWKHFKSIAQHHKKYFCMVTQAKLRSYNMAPKYIFRCKISQNYKHALELDKHNGNTKMARLHQTRDAAADGL